MKLGGSNDSLRGAGPRLSAGGRVDRESGEAGAIFGVSVIERGPVLDSRPWEIDDTTLLQVVEAGNSAALGVKSRASHPNMCRDGLGRELGRMTNFRLSDDGDRVLADLHLLDAARRSPEGDLTTWLLDMAEEAPDLVELSIAPSEVDHEPALDENGNRRLNKAGDSISLYRLVGPLRGVDLVDKGAANRKGLFGDSLAAKATDALDELIDPDDELDLVALAEQMDNLPDAALLLSGLSDLAATNDIDRAAEWLSTYLDSRGVAAGPITGSDLGELLTRAHPKESDMTVKNGAGADLDAARDEARKAETERQKEIRALLSAHGDQHDLSDLGDELLNGGASLDTARKRILDRIAERRSDVGPTTIEGGLDQAEKLGAELSAVTDAICGVQDAESAKLAASSSVRTRSIKRIGAIFAEQVLNVRNASHLDDLSLFRTLFPSSGLAAGGVPAHSSSSFAHIVSTSVNKVMLEGYETAETTWRLGWCRIGSLNDFRPHERIRWSEPAMLDQNPEGMPAREGTFTERKESIKALRFSKAWSFSYELFRNDDMGQVADGARQIGDGAALTVERRLWNDIVLANSGAGPLLQDGKALLHADHANLADAGAAPSQATVEAALVAMHSHTGIGQDGPSIPLGVTPRYALAGMAPANELEKIVGSTYAGDDSTAGRRPQLRQVQQIMPIRVPWLTVNAPNAWMLLGDPTRAPVFEVAFLDGVQTATTEMVTGGTIDGMRSWVRMYFDAGVTGSFEGAYRNAGA